MVVLYDRLIHVIHVDLEIGPVLKCVNVGLEVDPVLKCVNVGLEVDLVLKGLNNYRPTDRPCA